MHNRALLAEMPGEFACAAGPARTTGQTPYQVVVGPAIDSYSINTPFDSTRGVDLREITDGALNTVLVFEADTPVPWTKPDDLRWTPEGPLPRLTSNHAGGTHVLLAEGERGSSSRPSRRLASRDSHHKRRRSNQCLISAARQACPGFVHPVTP